MAQEKQIKTCEEYVLNDLFNAQKEVVALKNEKEELELQLRVVESRYSDLINLIKDSLKGNSEVSTNDNTPYYHVRVNGSYIGLYSKENDSYNDDSKLRKLAELIELANSIVERED